MTALEPSWLPPPHRLILSENDVHIWRSELDKPPFLKDEFQQTLSEDEWKRAESLHFERDRRRFIVCRGRLRTILSLYSGIESGKLHFSYGSKGKPRLQKKWGCGKLQFNLSHSHNLSLYAVTQGHEIGIDLEHIHPMPDAAQIATRFFSHRENDVFSALPSDQKLEAFFNCWTRKEAVIKAIGEGLSLPLDQFDVSFTPGQPARLLSLEGNPKEASLWFLEAFIPALGYTAALALKGHNWNFSYWQFPQ